MELTRIYAGKIRDELKAAVDTRKLAEAWAALHPKDVGKATLETGPGSMSALAASGTLPAAAYPANTRTVRVQVPAATPRGTGAERGVSPTGMVSKALDPVLAAFLARARDAIMAALRRILPAAWTEGWALGQQSAIASARSVASASLPEVNWGDWAPGDVEAAYQVAGSGLRDLLASQEVNIKSIAGSKLEELGDILAAHLSSPETERPFLPEPVPPMYSVDSLADALEEVLDNPERAELVAHTEIARAQSQAAQWVFQHMGISEVRISTAGDRRVCQACLSAEAAGAQPVGEYTVPLHPRCRCATVAVSPPLSSSLPGVAAALAGAS